MAQAQAIDDHLDIFDQQVAYWEDSVIGAVLAYPECRKSISQILSPSDFRRLDFGQMFRLVVESPLADAIPIIRNNNLFSNDFNANDALLLVRRSLVQGHHQAVLDAALLKRSVRLRKLQQLCYRTLDNATNVFVDPQELIDEIIGEIAELKECPKCELSVEAASDVCEKHQQLKEPLIDGLLRIGEIMNVIAPSKFGKTWLVLMLAVCVAEGTEWLGFKAKARRVLLIDNELHKETIADRLRLVCRKMGLASIPSNIDILSVRGQSLSINDIAEQVGDSLNGKYGLVIMDALYRFLPDKTNENANADMTRVYNTLDAIARRNGCAIALIHHSSKGDQSGKESIDVGAGAGAITRATDSHLIMRRHELDGCAVLELDARSWPPIETQTIQFDFPLWTAKHIPPQIKQSSSNRDVKQKNQDSEADQKILTVLEGTKGLSRPQLRTKTGYGPDRINRAIVRLLEAKKLEAKSRKNLKTGKRIEVFKCTAECTAECTNISPNI